MKLLFVICNFEIGGTRRSLLNLLSYMSSNYDVDLELLVFSPYGAYKDMVPEKVKLIEGNWLMQGHFSEKKTISHKYNLMLSRAIGSVGKKLIGEDRFWAFILRDFANKNIDSGYDAIIGFQEGFSNFFTTFTSIEPRFVWMHNDYNNIPQYRTRSAEAYSKVDRFFFVAETARKSFARAYPSLKNRMAVIKNIVPIDDIRKKAQEKINEDYYQEDRINIISVGRIEKQKAFERIVGILNILGEKKNRINWVVIGDGSQKSLIESNLEQRGYKDIVHFIGTRNNPYPYMARADLYVLTSAYESQPMVIMESLISGTPVISTNFDSAYELLENKKYGRICENSEKGIASILIDIINNPGIMEQMKQHTKEFSYDNDVIVQQIFNEINKSKSRKRVN